MIIEFTGVPCSGKSDISHKLAKILRQQGISVCEEQYEHSHSGNALKRISKKMLSCLSYCLRHPVRAVKCYLLIGSLRNWMNYIYLLSHKCKSKICILEQGYLQLIGSCFDNAAPDAEKMGQLFKALIPSADMVSVFVTLSRETVWKRAEAREDKPFFVYAEQPEVSLDYAISTGQQLRQLWLQNKGDGKLIFVSNEEDNSQYEVAKTVFDIMKQKGLL